MYATSLPEVVGDAGLYFDPFDVDDIAGKIIQMKDMVSDKEGIRINGLREY